MAEVQQEQRNLLERFLRENNIEESRLRDLQVEINYGGRNVRRFNFPRNRWRLAPFNEDLSHPRFQQLPKLFQDCDNIENMPEYEGRDHEIKHLLENMPGGVILEYDSYEVKLIRFCLCRVIVKKSSRNYEGIKRYSTLFTSSTTVFSYIDQFQSKKKLTDVEIYFGNEKVKLKITPKPELKQEWKELKILSLTENGKRTRTPTFFHRPLGSASSLK